MVQQATSVPQEELAPAIARIYAKQQAFFASGQTRDYAFRKAQLQRLWDAVKAYEPRVMEALYKDFRKPEFETYGTELGTLYAEIRHTLSHLKRWMKPRRVKTPLPFLPSSSWTYRDPLGITLIISPWNYPFLLMMHPLASAMAAGNTMILKPSEIAPHTEQVIVELIREYFDEEYIAVITGDGLEVGKALLENYHFDQVFFTGSVPVGRKIMEMASRHLSPVTLELGGKSPCIIEQDADLRFAAKKVAWGKFVNAGQTCVAPDYLLVHASVKDRFIDELKRVIRNMYGEDPQKSPDYARIISDKRFASLLTYLDNGKVVQGGASDASERYIAPTILEAVKADDPVMTEEIFGPILPVITFTSREEVLEWIGRSPYPLALYVFTSSTKTADGYIEQIRFGGGCVNNTLIHLGNPDLPFGGVGNSGIGQYHGEHGFLAFSRVKSILRTPTWFDVPFWYAPYKGHLKLIRKIFR
jgi:aldehyde dehydrogenase (NAD+)